MPFFQGACTALVTPFLNGKVNYTMLEQLIHRQLQAGIHALVLCGTTGESPTLSDAEKLQIFHHGKLCAPEAKIICGTGSNDTRHAIDLSQAAEDAGADALLVVSPYYNKSTPKGLVDHYSAIAAAVHIPIIIYNVPSRTGVDIPVSVYQELSQIANITGVKEASTDITKTAKIIAQCPDHFCVWSGNDDMTVPILSLGGMGVISVVSNVAPMEVQEMCLAALSGSFDIAAALQAELMDLTTACFSEVNPIPVKAAMKLIGYDCGSCRPPLSEPSTDTLKKLTALLT